VSACAWVALPPRCEAAGDRHVRERRQQSRHARWSQPEAPAGRPQDEGRDRPVSGAGVAAGTPADPPASRVPLPRAACDRTGAAPPDTVCYNRFIDSPKLP
jgi:hypothetical protein